MFSWLNFEELLIHNPIELINPSKDTISVAMSKKQYIEFFSNKYTYNGLYYDEAMDFCLFYYADPLQSYKEGDVYAQGYIDVEMKIYRVKWLCNVSISRSSGLLQTNDGTQGVPQEGGKYTHTAWSNSADGTDGFTTVYPNLNLLNDTTFKNYIPQTEQYFNVVIKNGGVNNKPYISVSYNNPTENSYIDIIQWGNWGSQGFDKESFKTSTTYTFSFYLKGSGTIRTHVYPSIIDISSGNGLVDGKAIGLSPDGEYNWNLTSEWVRHTYTFTTKSSMTENQNFLFRLFTGNSVDICLPKLEEGSTATPYMQSQSEVTSADGPSYIGQYTDYTLDDSTNPSSYTWREIQEDKWNVTKIGILISPQNKQITTVLNGALSECTKDKNITGWRNSQPNANYNYRQPQYSLDIGVDDFIISGYGLRGLKNG